MDKLLTITHTKDGYNVLNAIDLYNYLEIKDIKFKDWMKQAIWERRMVENMDYWVHTNKLEKTNPQIEETIEYRIRMEIAKDLAFIEGGEKAIHAISYFRECRVQLHMIAKRFDHLIPKNYVDALILAGNMQKSIDTLKKQCEEKQQLIDQLHGVIKNQNRLLKRFSGNIVPYNLAPKKNGRIDSYKKYFHKSRIMRTNNTQTDVKIKMQIDKNQVNISSQEDKKSYSFLGKGIKYINNKILLLLLVAMISWGVIELND